MSRIFGYGNKNIAYINTLKRRIFYSLVIVTFLLNIFVGIAINLKNMSDEALSNTTLIIDLQNDLTENDKNKLEEKLFSMSEIKSLKFMDKTESFKNLQKELNISIPESNNPLYDAVIINLKDSSYTNRIQENLENFNEIKEVYKNDEYIKIKTDLGILYSSIEFFFIIISVLLFIVSIFIFHMGVGIDFLNFCNCRNDYKKTFHLCKLKALLPFSAATLIALLLFFNVYVYSRMYLLPEKILSLIFSWRELFIYNIIIFLILNLIVWALPITSFKVNIDEENEDDENDEDLYEELFNKE